ncbi:hypothetical protein LBLM1_02915 [Limosilactobacillus mucosae LM1]|uniref:Uncharacterized protein n=1 Tax=Limosilactobacillus mucosae LM1 TaxID=1130798 RepID=A0A0D4CJA4_LIMMU|nr:hypothetical protein [Limosilactobacillus mucosae]AJT50124.1 hypothetical protein LBLM1_02915 [Limosilactobacillus mucosae LM1]
MKILAKLFYALAIISIVLIGVGAIVAIWFNGSIGFKISLTSMTSAVVSIAVAMGLGIDDL